jgi:hypothetical protein
MANRPRAWRPRSCSITLSEGEHTELRRLCDTLHVVARDLLLNGMKQAARRLAKAERRQRKNGSV